MREQKDIIMDFEKLPQNPGEVLEINTRDKKLNQVMRETIVELKRIVREKKLDGLTACQIGVNERIMVLRFTDDNIQSYINPVITQARDFTLSRETCVHLPNKQFLVPRNKEIVLTFETPLGGVMQARLVGKAAYVAQHLIWHMDGMYIDEVGIEIDDDWDDLTTDEKSEIIKQYAESVDMEYKNLQEELSKSEEAQKMYGAIEFDKALTKGEVKVREEKFTVEEENDETQLSEIKEEDNGEQQNTIEKN